MGTRSRIGLQVNGGIVSVYHHWDGYPEWLGRVLVEHFPTEEKVRELIDGGDMSCCWSDSDWQLEKIEERPLYYSERGEDCPPELHKDTKEFLAFQKDGEYAYLFSTDDVWYAWSTENWGDNAKSTPVEIPFPTAA